MKDSQIQVIIIVLATVVPVTAIAAVGWFLWRRSRQRRRFLFMKRGITPINDEEIESWKRDRSHEKAQIIEAANREARDLEGQQQQQKEHEYLQRQKSTSFSSIRKPPSVIVYDRPHPRVSEELSPRSIHYKRSIDLPSTPVLARAPNSRPGLTDEAVQGEDAFISPMKRQPSRLAKLPPSSRHSRTRSSRSSTMSAVSPHDPWHGHYPDAFIGTRSSSEYLPRAHQSLDIRRQQPRTHFMSSTNRLSFDEEVYLGGLSPRPLVRQSEIGRAIG
ncbi:hypothetical protein SNK03_001362 [Fusarium graminearum]|uniref:Chromosome 1, complete genome n=2 Tax=Gibberella zeae TaxID=5518 RepID=I1RC78_GIBZE|nr:hypothetical protein FGSG_01181 [Fusarium graminearum PH-1]EYB22130.1 hypothetical protein FG05_01181 [Fusarium graminearum]ESU06468.1 hypothetical protein FGSG_01181 [Fusarium graminearum PH-1]KAI6758951.1 hypothetical protein HG531_013947 [Fusarium graminearum]PCD22647.1 hypothetical protein FGRA07_04017 [Fusarium graminearum]CAF3481190.1 unnamed protein product [Fusarium graminearum]|eukprot:XP_011316953.1 hypothetical protein FGSG_01181 [Fusarium graminearum PH-1]